MEKIYFKKGNEAKDLKELMIFLFEDGGYSVETYHNENFTNIQCYSGSRRSFEDLLAISNTYYPNTTEEQLMKVLIDIEIKFYHCGDIKKVVFHYYGNYLIALNCFENMVLHGSIRDDTYSPSDLTKILNKVLNEQI